MEPAAYEEVGEIIGTITGAVRLAEQAVTSGDLVAACARLSEIGGGAATGQHRDGRAGLPGPVRSGPGLSLRRPGVSLTRWRP
jgi:hypothetical protein